MGRQFALIFLFTGDTGHLLRQPYQLHLESVCVSAYGVGCPRGRYPEHLSTGFASDTGDIAFDVADVFAQIGVPPGLPDHIIITAFTAAFAMRRIRPLLAIVLQFHVPTSSPSTRVTDDTLHGSTIPMTSEMNSFRVLTIMKHLSEDVSIFANGLPTVFQKEA